MRGVTRALKDPFEQVGLPGCVGVHHVDLVDPVTISLANTIFEPKADDGPPTGSAVWDGPMIGKKLLLDMVRQASKTACFGDKMGVVLETFLDIPIHDHLIRQSFAPGTR